MCNRDPTDTSTWRPRSSTAAASPTAPFCGSSPQVDRARSHVPPDPERSAHERTTMTARTIILSAALVASGLVARPPLDAQAPASDAPLAAPVFHHLHLNSVGPDAAI